MTSSKPNQTEEILQFPCDFPLKVFGLNRPDFEFTIIDILKIHCSESTQFTVKKNESRKGKYQSLTVNFNATSRQQLDDIYQSLTDSDQVVMSL